MPAHTAWDPAYEIGHAGLDAQHRDLLAQCQALAEASAAEDTGPVRQRFDQALATLRGLAATHFQTELELLAQRGYPELEEHRFECEEFDYLCEEVGTTQHFDRGELQRFLTLWFVGHIAGPAARLRAFLAEGSAPG